KPQAARRAAWPEHRVAGLAVEHDLSAAALFEVVEWTAAADLEELVRDLAAGAPRPRRLRRAEQGHRCRLHPVEDEHALVAGLRRRRSHEQRLPTAVGQMETLIADRAAAGRGKTRCDI